MEKVVSLQLRVASCEIVATITQQEKSPFGFFDCTIAIRPLTRLFVGRHKIRSPLHIIQEHYITLYCYSKSATCVAVCQRLKICSHFWSCFVVVVVARLVGSWQQVDAFAAASTHKHGCFLRTRAHPTTTLSANEATGFARGRKLADRIQSHFHSLPFLAIIYLDHDASS